MTDKDWKPIFTAALIPVIAMVVCAIVGNSIIAIICLAISIIIFLLARIFEMKCFDIIIIWLCGISTVLLSLI